MRYVDKVMPEVVRNLNAEQRDCVQKVLEAKDYVLVRGLPGSGKCLKEGPLTKNGPIDFAHSWAIHMKKSN
jgi:hypothetical protein